MTIFVNPEASVNGTGTFASPFNTWSSVDFSSDSVFAQAAGTSLYSSADSAILINVGGTANARKTLCTYDLTTGALTRKRAFIKRANRFGINILANLGFWTIKNFDVSGVGDGLSVCNGITSAVSPTNDSQDMSIYVENCVVHDLIPGADFVNGINMRGANNKVIGNIVYNIPSDGIQTRGTNLQVLFNKVYDVNTDKRNLSDCLQCMGDTSGTFVYGNYFDSSTTTGKQCIIFNDPINPDNFRFVFNNILIGGPSAQQCIFTDSKMQIAHNLFINGVHGIRADVAGCEIWGNLFLNFVSTTYRAIWLEQDGSTVVGNTVVSSAPRVIGTWGIYCESGHSNHTIENNILVGLGRGMRLSTSPAQLENYNCFFNNIINILSPTSTSITIGANSIQEDPEFNNGYKPTNPNLIGAGTPNGKSDFYNKQYKTPPTIGAVEN